MRYRFLSVFDTVFRYLPIFLTVLGYWIPPNVTLKNMWRENILDHEYLWRESTQIEPVRVKRWHNRYEILN